MAGASRIEIGAGAAEWAEVRFWDSMTFERIENFADSLYVLPYCKNGTNVLIYKHCLIHQLPEERNGILGVDAE